MNSRVAVITGLMLVAAGLYIVFFPNSSPGVCLAGWGGPLSPIALRNCSFNTAPEAGRLFLGTLLFGLGVLAGAVWSLLIAVGMRDRTAALLAVAFLVVAAVSVVTLAAK